ncbi:hypothetical protein ACSBR2_031318 [Camellia fascicularis]
MELSLRSSSLSSRGLCLRSLNLKGSCPSSAELPLPATLGFKNENVCLKDWWLVKVKRYFQRTRVAIAVFTFNGYQFMYLIGQF